MLMLGPVALAIARNARQWTAAFAIAFGVWDIVFYVCLQLLLGWPASLLTWDILFLIPVPWGRPGDGARAGLAGYDCRGDLVSVAGGSQQIRAGGGLERCWRPVRSTGDHFVFHARLPEHHGGRGAAPIPLGGIWPGDRDWQPQVTVQAARRNDRIE